MKALFVAAAAIALSIPAAAQNQPGAASAPTTVDIQVCNQSGRSARVAVSYIEVGSGRFDNRGWFEVANGGCTSLVSTENANFYLYGETLDGSGRTWSGDHTLCVQYPGPYAFTADGTDTCPAGYETRDFIVMRAAETGPYTWTLEP